MRATWKPLLFAALLLGLVLSACQIITGLDTVPVIPDGVDASTVKKDAGTKKTDGGQIDGGVDPTPTSTCLELGAEGCSAVAPCCQPSNLDSNSIVLCDGSPTKCLTCGRAGSPIGSNTICCDKQAPVDKNGVRTCPGECAAQTKACNTSGQCCGVPTAGVDATCKGNICQTCSKEGSSCTDNGSCCGGGTALFCKTGGQCGKCGNQGESCGNDDDCCKFSNGAKQPCVGGKCGCKSATEGCARNEDCCAPTGLNLCNASNKCGCLNAGDTCAANRPNDCCGAGLSGEGRNLCNSQTKCGCIARDGACQTGGECCTSNGTKKCTSTNKCGCRNYGEACGETNDCCAEPGIACVQRSGADAKTCCTAAGTAPKNGEVARCCSNALETLMDGGIGTKCAPVQ